jgi:hypothetical protein
MPPRSRPPGQPGQPGQPPGYPPQPWPPGAGYPAQPGYPYPPQQGYPPPQQRRPTPSPELQRDAAAAWGARLELGPTFEEHIAAGLAERVEELAAMQLAQLRRDSEQSDRAFAAEQKGRGRQFALGIVTTVMAVPITAITTNSGGYELMSTGIAWVGLVAVNVVHALGLRRPRH